MKRRRTCRATSVSLSCDERSKCKSIWMLCCIPSTTLPHLQLPSIIYRNSGCRMILPLRLVSWLWLEEKMNIKILSRSRFNWGLRSFWIVVLSIQIKCFVIKLYMLKNWTTSLWLSWIIANKWYLFRLPHRRFKIFFITNSFKFQYH